MVYDSRLIGKQIFLQSIKREHCNVIYLNWLQDSMVNRYLETRWEDQTIDKIIDFVEGINASSHSYLFGIFLREEERHIGNIKIGPVNERYLYADISYFIGEKLFWGRGIATEAISLITMFGFQELGLHRIQAGAFGENKSSIRALIKAGFKVEGCLKGKMYTSNACDDDILLGILKDDFYKEKA